jgi:sugar phosphate isomerase/epimerase
MRFAVFTVSTPEYTPDEVLTVLAELGYEGVEWRVVDQEPSADGQPTFWKGNLCTLTLSNFVENAPRIRALTDQAGLATTNVGAYARCDDVASLERVFRGSALLGAPSARVQVPRYDGRQSYKALRERAQAQFRDVEALAHQFGVRAIVETHPDTITPSASALAWFLEPFDPRRTGALWDPGNMVKEGYEQYRLGLETLGPYLAHVQLKNAAWRPLGQRADASTAWQIEWAPLRSGVVDVAAVFQALNAVGYDGWISIEDFSTEQPVKARLRDNLAYVRSLVGVATASQGL